MPRENINDLVVFIAIAREGSFTKAAAKMGVSQSALSHSIRQLEERLGIRLFTRTTRAVSPTEAGQSLLTGIGPHFDSIEQELEALNLFRDKPAGTIRIAASSDTVSHLLWPKIRDFLPEYPQISVELFSDNGLTDIVNGRFDAGVRLGDQIAKDMIAVRIGPNIRFAAVATPEFFKQHGKPATPQQLTQFQCINFRLPTAGGLYAWEFEENGEEFKVRVDGQLVFNEVYHIIQATLDGFGISYMPEDLARPHLETGKFERVLDAWCPLWEGPYLYYPNWRQSPPAFSALVEALRHRP